MDLYQIIFTLLLWGLFFGNEEQRDRSLIIISGVSVLLVIRIVFEIMSIFIETEYIYGICFLALLIHIIFAP